MLVGKAPGMQTAGKAIAESPIGQTVGNIAKTDIGQEVRKIPNALKSILKYDNALKQAEKSQVALENVRNILGSAKRLAIQEISDVPAELNWGINKSQKIVEAIKNPIYEVEFTPEGGVKNTIGNLDKVKEAVGELLTPKMRLESTKKEISLIRQFEGQVSNTMKTAARKAGKPIDAVMKNYGDFMDRYHMIKHTIENSKGEAMGNKLRKTFDLLSEPAYKESWKEVSKISPEVKTIMNSMQRRSLLRDLIKGGVTAETAKKVFTGKF
jgi:hypothetical protein